MTLSLNHYWRIAAAGISYVVFAIGAFIPGIYVFCLALFPLDAKAKQKRARLAIKGLCRFYVDFMQFLGLLDYHLEQNHERPISGHLVISNHSTLIDALFILAYVDDLCCVVKDQLLHNPITRIPVRLAGYISNNADDFIDSAVAKIAAGENILIFPEGTRNQFDTQLEFKRGAANIAIFSHSPILPILIRCSPRTLQKGQSWHELPSVKSNILVRINPSLQIKDCVDQSLPRTLQYRRLTEFWREYYLQQLKALAS